MSKKSAAVAVILLLGDDEERKKSIRRSVWAKRWLQQRRKYSHVKLLRELELNSEDDNKMYLRMSSEYFRKLLSCVEPLISKGNTVVREAIPAEDRPTATLRFLATGRSLEDLKFSTAIFVQVLGKIIPETCDAIFEVLREEYMKVRNTSYFSIVLLALTNANYEFVMIAVGTNGRVSDGGVLLSALVNTISNLLICENSVPKESRKFVRYNGKLIPCIAHKMYFSPGKAESVVKVCCILHNYPRRNCRVIYSPSTLIDGEDIERGTVTAGSWRNNLPRTTFSELHVGQV
ncbi:hypothetical protein PR048_008430 [Dryococelus australis]|uniref:Uncharacterized protein n=1 Tax=Dryococelus australis TaxID=614101 RepID=A0ABQ9HXV8_9NEOP|nr:hypothetical protein PR048_008430 [Dryococelus australis]